MSKIVVFDCEYLTKEGAMGRLWSGHDDPDPMVVQIGAVLLDLDDDARIVDETKIYVKPEGRDGALYLLDPYFIELTGISDEVLATDAVDLGEALHRLDDFSQGADFWSWGKDELLALGVSCFLRGLVPPIGARRFGNLKSVFLRTGMTETHIKATNSGQLAGYYGVDSAALSEHDALDDARSLARALGHLMEKGHLSNDTFGS